MCVAPHLFNIIYLGVDLFEHIPEFIAFFAFGIEVFHQLHCVNMLRQATYMDYYLPRNKEWEDQKTLRYHLGQSLRIKKRDG